jgi:hypothetical protein
MLIPYNHNIMDLYKTPRRLMSSNHILDLPRGRAAVAEVSAPRAQWNFFGLVMNSLCLITLFWIW